LNRAHIAVGQLEIDGRDAILSGTVPTHEVADLAVKRVNDVYGVRTVRNKLSVEAPLAVEEPPAEEPPAAEVVETEPEEPGLEAEKTQTALDALLSANQINFRIDSAEILPESYPLLDQIAQVLKENPGVTVEVAGHTDNTGDAEYNLALSRRRAESVRDYLVAQGISQDQLLTTYYGEARPIASNSTPEGKKKNRRTEFTVVKEK
jgi:OOP family OmpA-OmpF porin